jgi:CO dehydrogenase maturation factor
LKLAISGKGGGGKSTLAAALSLLLARRSARVIAVDMDPAGNLASSLGLSRKEKERIIPISRQVDLIEERTGARVKEYGQVFRINPQVSDIADRFAVMHEGVALLVLGAVPSGGGGCACPENTLIRALVADLVLSRNETLIMDMEAGVEHLGRATARGVDVLLVVVEPSQGAVDCARRIVPMACEIGLSRILIVANKVQGERDKEFLAKAFPDKELFGVIPYSEEIRAADRESRSVLQGLDPEILSRFEAILTHLEAQIIS